MWSKLKLPILSQKKKIGLSGLSWVAQSIPQKTENKCNDLKESKQKENSEDN